jgi:RNA polymerase sigma factor for flagellar operon FliA
MGRIVRHVIGPGGSRGAKMQRQPVTDAQRDRITAGVPFVEGLARRVAASMPHSIDLGDLVQDGMLGLIDAAHRYDESRGIKFETFAERRVRGAMIDALRRDAWPRGVRRMRRQLETAREDLRRELGYEPSMADLAARVGSDEARLNRTIVRINTIESTSPLATIESADEGMLPAVLLPSEPPSPDRLYEQGEIKDRVRAAIATLPPRERRIIGLYYFADVTMKQIGATIGVNESRVSQLHARAMQRLRKALGAAQPFTPVMAAAPALSSAQVVSLAAVTGRKQMARATLDGVAAPVRREIAVAADSPAVVLSYPSASRATRNRSASLNGLVSQRQPLCSRKRSASVPATSPVTNTMRRASDGELAAMAR